MKHRRGRRSFREGAARGASILLLLSAAACDGSAGAPVDAGPPVLPGGPARVLLATDGGHLLALAPEAPAGDAGAPDGGGAIRLYESADGIGYALRELVRGPAGTTETAPALGRAGDGGLRLAVRREGGPGAPGALFLHASTPGSAGLGEGRPISTAPYLDARPHGRIARLDDGALLLGVTLRYAAAPDAELPPSQQGDRAATLRSDDDGLTWSPPRLLPGPARAPLLVALGGTRIAAIVRAPDGRLATAWSDDAGVHWTVPRPLYAEAMGEPELLATAGAAGAPPRLVLLYVSSATGELLAQWSDDGGHSYGAPLRATLPGPAPAAGADVVAALSPGRAEEALAWAGPVPVSTVAGGAVPSTFHPAALDAGAWAEIGGRWQLLTDDQLVHTLDGLRMVVHAADKTGEVLLQADRPWESYLTADYPSVLAEGARVRVWFESYDLAYAKGDFSALLGVADSVAGGPFQKPSLGLVAYAGSTATNLVFPTNPAWSHHGGSVFVDPIAPPAERYKLLAMGDNGVRGAVSPDGLRFTRIEDYTLLGISSDTQNVGFYDDEAGLYVAYVRHRDAIGRVIARAESRDFRVFGVDYAVMSPDAADPPTVDLYSSAASKYPGAPGTYLAFPSYYDRATQKVAVAFASSRDGVAWTRYRSDLLPLGPPGAFDDMTLYAAPGVVCDGGGLWIYYVGYDVGHDEAWPDSVSRLGVLSRARLRVDGFRSAEGTGTLTTRPLRFAGEHLRVNATGTVGCEILDEQGAPIAGYEDREEGRSHGDALRGEIRFASDPRGIAGRRVRLRFHLESAALYAFGFGDAPPCAP